MLLSLVLVILLPEVGTTLWVLRYSTLMSVVFRCVVACVMLTVMPLLFMMMMCSFMVGILVFASRVLVMLCRKLMVMEMFLVLLLGMFVRWLFRYLTVMQNVPNFRLCSRVSAMLWFILMLQRNLVFTVLTMLILVRTMLPFSPQVGTLQASTLLGCVSSLNMMGPQLCLVRQKV